MKLGKTGTRGERSHEVKIVGWYCCFGTTSVVLSRVSVSAQGNGR